MLTNEAAGLAISVAKGLIKLHGRLDEVLAERAATTAPLALPVPMLRLAPPPEIMRPALEGLLTEADSNLTNIDRTEIREAGDRSRSRRDAA